MALASAQRQWEALHKDRPYHDGTFRSWAEKASTAHPYHYSDGVVVWVSDEDLTPEDGFLDVESPGLAGAEQAAEQVGQADDAGD